MPGEGPRVDGPAGGCPSAGLGAAIPLQQGGEADGAGGDSHEHLWVSVTV